MNISPFSYSTPTSKGITIGNTDLYFSYQTLIAIRKNGRLFVRENDWSTTTGKHLNAIDGGSYQAKKERLPGREFMAKVEELIGNDQEMARITDIATRIL
jgi:hypothetical protein